MISERISTLTDREKQIIILVCKGLTNREIGERLFLSPRTIESHRNRISSKTETSNVAELVVYAIKNNIFCID